MTTDETVKEPTGMQMADVIEGSMKTMRWLEKADEKAATEKSSPKPIGSPGDWNTTPALFINSSVWCFLMKQICVLLVVAVVVKCVILLSGLPFVFSSVGSHRRATLRPRIVWHDCSRTATSPESRPEWPHGDNSRRAVFEWGIDSLSARGNPWRTIGSVGERPESSNPCLECPRRIFVDSR